MHRGITTSKPVYFLTPEQKADNRLSARVVGAFAAQEEVGIAQEVMRGGSTNAGKISLTGQAVPVLVLGIPSRYVHSHYNFCVKSDIEAAVSMAVEVIRGLNVENMKRIFRQDVI